MTRYFSITFSLLWLFVFIYLFFFGAGVFRVFGEPSSTVSSTVSISVEVPGAGGGDSSPLPPEVTILPTPGNATLIFRGFTSPEALIYFFADSTLLATDKADSDGIFTRTLLVNSGISNFGIAAKDKHGLLSSTSNLSLNILSFSTTTVSNIFLSPTIQVDNAELLKGVPANLSGSTYPQSTVFLTLDNEQIAETLVDAYGAWRYRLTTRNLKGHHTVSAKAIISSMGYISTPSPVIDLEIIERVCPGPDLNQDGAVDVADLSIMLFYWREQNPKNQCVDLNADGVVDMADLSLLMYAWTGNRL